MEMEFGLGKLTKKAARVRGDWHADSLAGEHRRERRHGITEHTLHKPDISFCGEAVQGLDIATGIWRRRLFDDVHGATGQGDHDAGMIVASEVLGTMTERQTLTSSFSTCC